MFSATEKGATSRKCWCTIAMPASSASRGEWNSTGSPKSTISPSSGRYRPVRMFESVVLPAPFPPSRACPSPAAASKSTRSFATTPGNRFVIPRSATAGPTAGEGSGEAGASPLNSLTLRATDDAFHEPVHRVQVPDGHPLPLGDAQLALLVVQRAGELVERALLQRGLLLRDRRLRLRGDLRTVWSNVREAVLDRAVVEVRLPRPVHRGLRLAQVVRAPVVDRGRE